MESQYTSHILMIRPVNFAYNEAAAESNAFMHDTAKTDDPQNTALQLFDAFVEKLREADIKVHVFDDRKEPYTPDSIFPNNWVSFHADGRVFLYPMEVENRRLEKRMDILDSLKKEFELKEIVDLSHWEKKGLFLEGTGSLVLDRANKAAYVCRSSRSSELVLSDWHSHFGAYEIVVFNAVDRNGQAIYHTNVLMAIGRTFALVCLDAIPDKAEKEALVMSFIQNEKEVIAIDFSQMENFAGNMLQVCNTQGDEILVMSTRAFESLTKEQIECLEKHSTILHAELGPIETLGGGSARCMLAEIHLPEYAS
ncbi:amidinotransferase [Marinilongibacter aquaticus]|uniref:citrulline utilization hydrolase CtlX n=1 Tax=Marinilongibacter aquaticus TaxID=2975157 RepID=UPI0021BDA46D|nr:arginine deiminase-related protein [Marinilongibacter aquaticus]UBM59156.1 amidinotransferase [Marinilongibacter aquaticus]